VATRDSYRCYSETYAARVAPHATVWCGCFDRLRAMMNHASPITMSDAITGLQSVKDIDDENETIDIRYSGLDREIIVCDITKVERIV
jgi:hypothetical protein